MAANTDGDSRAAYGRWVNDSYWLLAPLKLLDRGTNLSYEGDGSIDGKKCEMLRLSFGKVGLTPKDNYLFYIDSETKMPVHWDYMPAPQKKVSGTWEKFQDFGGLKLATDHQFGDKRIYFTGVSVTRNGSARPKSE